MGLASEDMAGCDNTHPVSPETARKTEETSPPNIAIVAPAAFIPRNFNLLYMVAVKIPSGMAAPNCRNEMMRTTGPNLLK